MITLFRLADIDSNLSSIHSLSSHGKGSISFLTGGEINMSEASAVSFLVLGHSDSEDVSVLGEGLLQGGLLGGETEVSDEQGAGIA